MMIPGEGVNGDQAVCEQLSRGQKEVLEREITEGNNVFFFFFSCFTQYFASYFVQTCVLLQGLLVICHKAPSIVLSNIYHTYMINDNNYATDINHNIDIQIDKN